MVMWLGSIRVAQNQIAANYRKIVLTCLISKILERVVRKDIIKYMDENYVWEIGKTDQGKGAQPYPNYYNIRMIY